MENLIIILSLLLNIALIIAVAIYMKRFNKVSEDYKKCVNDYESVAKEYRDISLELSDLRNLNTEINKQLVESSKSKSELIKKCDRQNSEIESLQSINNTIVNDNRKLSDEIIILKEQVESLNNHLQEQLKKHEGAKPEKKRNKKETEKESARH